MHIYSNIALEKKHATNSQSLVVALFGRQIMRHTVEPRTHSQGQTSLSFAFIMRTGFARHHIAYVPIPCILAEITIRLRGGRNNKKEKSPMCTLVAH